VTASASDPGAFFAGRIVQGLTTSLMLITAAPALVLGVAAFFTAPLLIHMAVTSGPDLASGVESATWVTFSGGLRLQAPDIDTWQEGEGPAIDSARSGRRYGDGSDR
jgi:hypothetical protein